MKKTKRKKRRMRRIGSSALLLLTLTLTGISYAGKKQKGGETYAVVGGTVFRESGLSLPGAEVAISPDPQAGQTAVKLRDSKAVSDSRGEFAFRVPVTAMRYTVKAKLKGFEPQQKSVDIEGEQRTDVTLILPVVSK
jgi:Carboxypeptidase regulatory-like domain